MASGQPVVAIFDGDPVVREALEVLLEAAGYRTRFLREPVEDELGERLAGCHLLLVAPEPSAERRKLLLATILGLPALVNIPILELLPEAAEPNVRDGRVLPWPCSMEELKGAIDALLLDQGRSDPA